MPLITQEEELAFIEIALADPDGCLITSPQTYGDLIRDTWRSIADTYDPKQYAKIWKRAQPAVAALNAQAHANVCAGVVETMIMSMAVCARSFPDSVQDVGPRVKKYMEHIRPECQGWPALQRYAELIAQALDYAQSAA